MAQKDDELYHDIQQTLTEALVETETTVKASDAKADTKAESKIKALKDKLGTLNKNIDKEYKIIKTQNFETDSPEVKHLLGLI